MVLYLSLHHVPAPACIHMSFSVAFGCFSTKMAQTTVNISILILKLHTNPFFHHPSFNTWLPYLLIKVSSRHILEMFSEIKIFLFVHCGWFVCNGILIPNCYFGTYYHQSLQQWCLYSIWLMHNIIVICVFKHIQVSVIV